MIKNSDGIAVQSHLPDSQPPLLIQEQTDIPDVLILRFPEVTLQNQTAAGTYIFLVDDLVINEQLGVNGRQPHLLHWGFLF